MHPDTARIPPSGTPDDTASIARIDTPDVAFIQPIREFLSQYGCSVAVNEPTPSRVGYHIISGDQEYVESILETTGIRGDRTLAIIWAYDPTVDKLRRHHHVKIALVGDGKLNDLRTHDIFNFMFTSRDTLHFVGPVVYRRRTADMPRINIDDSNKTRNQRVPDSLPLTAGKIVPKTDRPMPESYRAEHDTEQSGEDREADRKRIARTISHVYGTRPKALPVDRRKSTDTALRLLTGITAGIALACMPFIIYLISILATGLALYRSFSCMKTNQTTCMDTWSVVSSESLKTAEGAIKIISVPLSWVDMETMVSSHLRIVDILATLQSVITETVSLNAIGRTFAQSLMSASQSTEPTVPPAVASQQLKIELGNLRTNLDLAYAEMYSLSHEAGFPFTLPKVQSAFTRGLSTIDSSRTLIRSLDQFLMMYPKFAGFKDRQSYLILLQNSAELRPTGGFIGSLITVDLADGRVATLDVQDVYEKDGQLKGHVDPPGPVRDLLGNEHWYLRDSNWNPDYTESAGKALWFYEKESGVPLQGAIALTSDLITGILEATGPVRIPDLNDRISAENFQAKSLYYTQNGFFPGSTQKRDFLGMLSNALLQKILTDKTVSPLALYKVVSSGLSGRGIQMYFVDPELEALVSQFGWSGAFPARTGCDAVVSRRACLFDFLSINEANMGVNKTNTYIKRREARSTVIAPDGTVTETISRTIMNTASSEPGSGPYRVYMRVFAEGEGKVTSVTLDGQSVPTRGDATKPPALPYGEVIPSSTGSLPAIGLAFDALPASEHTVTVTVKRSIDLTVPSSLNIYIQKQAGVGSVPVSGTIRYPADWNVTPAATKNAALLANQGQFEYNSSLSGDVDITLQILANGVN